MFYFEDGRSLGPCSLDDPRAQTVRVLVQMTGGPVNFHMNEDRLGYVDRALGEERYALAIEAARLFVAAPELLAAAEALLSLDGDKEETKAALDRLEAATIRARRGDQDG
jgi:hypothetical protein